MTGFGERLRKLRRDRDVTQNQLAEFLGIKGAAVGKWETNENAYPNTDTLIKISEYFHVSTDFLLRGIQTLPTIEGNLNGSVVQNNVQSNVQGDIVVNGRSFSPEIMEVVRIYERLDGKGRIELSTFASGLEKKYFNES